MSLEDKLDRILHRLNHIDDRLDSLVDSVESTKTILEEFKMSVAQDMESLRQQMDQATTAVADRIDRLSGQIKNSMTDEEVASVKAGFQAEVDRLTGLGKDPTNPVPPEPPALAQKTPKK